MVFLPHHYQLDPTAIALSSLLPNPPHLRFHQPLCQHSRCGGNCHRKPSPGTHPTHTHTHTVARTQTHAYTHTVAHTTHTHTHTYYQSLFTLSFCSIDVCRSAATTLHTQLSHTSSLGRTVRDSSSDPPPPLPSKPQLFPKPAKLPPPVHPRSKPPLQAAASVESSRNGAFPTAGVKVQKSRPIPLNPSPGLKTQGAHFSGPPIPSENQKSHIPLSQPPGVENQRSHVPSNRPLGTETQCPPRAPIDINNRPPAPLPPEV